MYVQIHAFMEHKRITQNSIEILEIYILKFW